MKNLLTFIQNESGAGCIDYCCLTGLISAACIPSLRLIGERLNLVFMTIANALVIH